MAESKIYIKGSVKHNGVTYNRQYVEVGDGEGQVDAKSAQRLIDLGRAYKGRDAKAAEQEVEELEAAEAARQAALAGTPVTGTGAPEKAPAGATKGGKK